MAMSAGGGAFVPLNEGPLPPHAGPPPPYPGQQNTGPSPQYQSQSQAQGGQSGPPGQARPPPPASGSRFPPEMQTLGFGLLAAQWCLSLLTFALMSAQYDGLSGPSQAAVQLCGARLCPYSAFSELRYVVAIGVLWFVASSVLIVAIASQSPLPVISTTPAAEFGLFAVFAFLTFIAFCVGAAECNKTLVGGVQVCEGAGNPKAAVAFCFLLTLALCASSYVAFVNWRTAAANQQPGFAPAGTGGYEGASFA